MNYFGRAIRKSENKTFGIIVIPVYLSEISENINDQVLASKFSSVWKIILALKSQDDSLMEEIDSLRVSLGKTGNGNNHKIGLNKITIDFPKKITPQFAEKIQTILIRNTSSKWNEYLGQLIQFAKSSGHTKVPFTTLLGRWVSKQKKYFKNDIFI